MTTLTSQYLVLNLHLYTDMARLGAQVIAGIGFIGAGTIIITKRRQVKGLTTAAGLWATAAIGLAVGYGLYEPAFVTVIVVVLAFTVVSHLETHVNRKRQRMFVYLEIDSVASVREMTELLVSDFGAVSLQVTPPRSGNIPHVGIEALIRVPPKVSIEAKIQKLHKINHVIFALQIT